MSESNQFVLHYFFPMWLITAMFVIYGLTIWISFTKLLAKKFPSYYTKIGKPTLFASNDIRREVKIQIYMFKLLYGKLPEDLPKDPEILDLAQRLRRTNQIMLFPFAISMAVGIYGMMQGY